MRSVCTVAPSEAVVATLDLDFYAVGAEPTLLSGSVDAQILFDPLLVFGLAIGRQRLFFFNFFYFLLGSPFIAAIHSSSDVHLYLLSYTWTEQPAISCCPWPLPLEVNMVFVGDIASTCVFFF